jgi:transcriptional regulator with XRE-family HTH domain
LSQEGLAELSGLHRTYISGIERGVRNPTLSIILQIANALKVRPSELLCEGTDAEE